MSELVEIATDDEQVVKHADWAELQCLLKADRSVSREDLARALKRPGFVSEDTARELAVEAFDELQDRVDILSSVSTGTPVYPYKLDDRIEVITYVPQESASIHSLAYMFLLVVSRDNMSSKTRKRAGIDPTTVFEQLCAEVLRSFLGGDERCLTFHMGTGKGDKGRTRFPKAIRELCEMLCEGGTWKEAANSPGAGDGGVDIVAWRAFRDRRPGNLVGFAQCKTGTNWREHIGKLRPRGFCGKFMSAPPILEPRSIFMVPHRVHGLVWEDRMREGDIMLFDRCRIVEYASKLSDETRDRARRWLHAALASIEAVL